MKWLCPKCGSHEVSAYDEWSAQDFEYTVKLCKCDKCGTTFEARYTLTDLMILSEEEEK